MVLYAEAGNASMVHHSEARRDNIEGATQTGNLDHYANPSLVMPSHHSSSADDVIDVETVVYADVGGSKNKHVLNNNNRKQY